MSGSPESRRAALIEIFHSIQGEGRHVGVPMAFVRLAVCPLRCRYCDTPNSYVAEPTFRVAIGAAVRREPNPATAERAVTLALESAAASPFAAPGGVPVSITGGEPLVQPGFVRAFGELLVARGRLHLETAALDPDALRAVLPVLHHVSADWKLPETLESGDPADEHAACVRAVVERGGTVTLDVKIVVTNDVRVASFERALDRLAPHRQDLLLILQPVTPFGAILARPDPALVAELARRAGARGFAYRVLPQMHRILGLE